VDRWSDVAIEERPLELQVRRLQPVVEEIQFAEWRAPYDRHDPN
jgi:hypothetical protein